MSSDRAIEQALDELYSTDPSEFTKKRDALAKELKKAGNKDAAAALAARRKPTQIAYVLFAVGHEAALSPLWMMVILGWITFGLTIWSGIDYFIKVSRRVS